jgi:putative oxidoreductase
MIGRTLAPHSDRLYALLRVVSGLLFFFHGLQKLTGVYMPFPRPAVGTQLWIGAIIELVAGMAIALGFRTTLAAFLASGTMAVAYIQFHWKLALGSQFFPAVNQGELALLYSFLFLYVASRGAGPWSLDGRLRAGA